MSGNTIVIEGVVTAAGTLELENKVPLPAGRVTVTVQQVPLPNARKAEEVLAFIREIQALRESQGVMANSETALASAQRVRDEFDEQVEDAGRLQEECRRLRREADTRETK